MSVNFSSSEVRQSARKKFKIEMLSAAALAPASEPVRNRAKTPFNLCEAQHYLSENAPKIYSGAAVLKIVRTARRTCLAAACCLLLAPSPIVCAEAQNDPQQTPALLPLDAFSALVPEAKLLYLQGVTAHWTTTADGRDFTFLKSAVDSAVTPAGALQLPASQSLPFGRAILLVYRVTQNPIYYQAAKQLRTALQPQQDKGDIAAAPFLADFGVTFGDAAAADQASDILLRVDTTARDLETGLLIGTSSTLDLARNTFYAYDLLQAVDRLPIGYHHRRGLTEALNKTVSALIALQNDHEVWQTPNQPTQTLLLDAYVVAHGVRMGAFAQSDAALAKRMADAAQAAPTRADDAGARLLTQSEAPQTQTQSIGQGKTIMADAWFNAETRSTPAGNKELFRYKWEDATDTGLSFFGRALERYGVQLDTLRVAPTAASLSLSQVYLLAAPSSATGDTGSHALMKADGDTIEAWVKGGGVLLLIADAGPATDATQLNVLSDRFGMHFAGNASQAQPADANQEVEIPADTGVFSKAHRALIPNTCTLSLGPLAHPVLKDGTNTVMAVSSAGRGTVVAITSPWLSNKYLDGRTLPSGFDNFPASIDLAGWLLKLTLQ